MLHRKNSSLSEALINELLCMPAKQSTPSRHRRGNTLHPMPLYYSSVKIPSKIDGQSQLRVPHGWFFLATAKVAYTLAVDVPSLESLHGNVESKKEGEQQRKSENSTKGDEKRSSIRDKGKLPFSLAIIAVVRTGDQVLSAKLLNGPPRSSFSWNIGLRWRGGGGRLKVLFYSVAETSSTSLGGREWHQVEPEKWVRAGRELPQTEISVGLFSPAQDTKMRHETLPLSDGRGIKRSRGEAGFETLPTHNKARKEECDRQDEEKLSKRSRCSVSFQQSDNLDNA